MANVFTFQKKTYQMYSMGPYVVAIEIKSARIAPLNFEHRATRLHPIPHICYGEEYVAMQHGACPDNQNFVVINGRLLGQWRANSGSLIFSCANSSAITG